MPPPPAPTLSRTTSQLVPVSSVPTQVLQRGTTQVGTRVLSSEIQPPGARQHSVPLPFERRDSNTGAPIGTGYKESTIIGNKIAADTPIRIIKYETNFYFESMQFNKDEFVDVANNDFFKKMLLRAMGNNKYKRMYDNDTLVIKEENLFDKTNIEGKIDLISGKTSKGITELTNIKEEVLHKPISFLTQTIERFILSDVYREIFEFSINKLWTSNQDTLFILPSFNTDDNGTTKISDLLEKSTKLMYNAIFNIKKNDSTFQPSTYEDISYNKDIPPAKYTMAGRSDDTTKKSNSNQILFIHALPDNKNEPMDSYINTITRDIENIEQTIITRGNDKDRIRPISKIIFFVNPGSNDTMFTDYFKSKITKKYADEFNKQFNAFISRSKIGKQGLKIETNKNKLRLFSDTANSIQHAKKKYSSKIEYINDPAFKLNVGLLLSKLKTLYDKRVNISITKQLTSQDNSSLLNIYMRFSILDKPVITNKIIVSKNVLYKLFKNGIPTIGYFNSYNENKSQYMFMIDRTVNSKYKNMDEYTKKYKVILDKEKKRRDVRDARIELLKTKSTRTADEEDDLEKKSIEQAEEEEEKKQEIADLTLNTNNENTVVPIKSFLVEIRYSYGKIQYRDIQKNLSTPYKNENYITFHSERNIYEYYQFFKHKMIDSTLKDSIDIKYFKDTKYTIENLKAFLISEKLYKENARMALEFLKINVNDQILVKYNNFIFDNFKNDINTNLEKQDVFNEAIKKSIADIIFEQNSLVYVRITSEMREKEKEKATPDSFKIAHHDYETIKDVSKLNSNLSSYSKLEDEKQYFKGIDPEQQSPQELLQQLNNTKKTFAFAIVQITKDVLSDPVKLYFSTQCKTRRKKIIDGYYKLTSIIGGNSKRKNYKKNKKNKRITKRRRIYFSKYLKG